MGSSKALETETRHSRIMSSNEVSRPLYYLQLVCLCLPPWRTCKIVVLTLYVDDILLGGNNSALLERLGRLLMANFAKKYGLGECVSTVVLGMKITWHREAGWLKMQPLDTLLDAKGMHEYQATVVLHLSCNRHNARATISAVQ